MISTIIIKKPVITERSLKDAVSNIFTFEVDMHANKIEIIKAVESQFKVHVTAITTQVVKGKTKTVGKKRQKTKLPDRKKARLTLKKGEKIEIFEVGGK